MAKSSSLNRLTSFQRGTLSSAHDGIVGDPLASQSWNLDAVGNSASVTTDGVVEDRTTNAQNELTGVGSATQTYDGNGNTITDTTGKTYVFDAWNRLVEVKNGQTSLVRYGVDALGRRVQEGTSDIYFSDADQRIEVQVNGLTTEQETWSIVFVNCMIERDRDSNADGTLDERLWPMQDANWNVTALTNTSGTVVSRFLYSPYGVRTTLNTIWVATTDPYTFLQGYQGGFADPISGRIHFGYRDYDTGTMRWMEQDPAGYVDGSSLYAPMGCSPVNRLDPYGLWHEGAPGSPEFEAEARRNAMQQLLKWTEEQRADLRKKLKALCNTPHPQPIKGGSCECKKSLCESQAVELADAIVAAVVAERQAGHDSVGGVWGNIERFEILHVGHLGLDVNNCAAWQQAILNNISGLIHSQFQNGLSCLTVDRVDDNTGAQHHWIEIRRGNNTVIIDPWPSGGRGDISDDTAAKTRKPEDIKRSKLG